MLIAKQRCALHLHQSPPLSDRRCQPKRDKFSGLSRREKRRKLAMEEDAAETGAIKAAIRSAKKSSRPAKIGEVQKKLPSAKDKAKAKRKPKVVSSRAGAFDRDLGQRQQSREGVRSKKSDKIGGMGKKGGKRKGK